MGAGLLVFFIGAGASSTAAAAKPADATTVTYSATETIPAPPASNFQGSAGGDGWAVAMTPTAVYNVFHHSSTLQVACHLQTDASECWSAKTITDGSGNNFAISGQPGLWLDQATGKLYVYGDRQPDNTAGVVCIDTTQPAANPDPFCGFTALTPVGEAPVSGTSAVSDPVSVGGNWYAFNGVAGTPSGTEDQLMCFSLSTLSACPNQPFAVNLGAGTITSINFPSPSIAAFNQQVVIPINTSTGDRLACFDTSTSGQCAGSWPVDTTGISYPSTVNSQTAGGAAYPLLDANGATTGFCIPVGAIPCYSLSGASVATPPGMTSAVTPAYGWDGTGMILGARVYVPNGTANTVECYDYVMGASCSGFPKAMSNLDLLYTVNPDPQRPTCIWVNSDSGSAQIQNFDAYTGGTCGGNSVRVLASSLVAPYQACIPSNYTSLQVLTPARASYSSGTVEFEDFDGNPIPGIPTQNLDAAGAVDLTPLNLTTKSALPQFLITLTGAGTPPQVEVKVTWTGTYSSSCTSNGQSVSGNQGYRLGARDGGVFAFGQDGFFGSMGGQRLNGPIVGIASTSDNGGYWLAASDGGVFSFGDAAFHGSLGGTALNAPIVGMAATPDGKGYWLVASDGGVFSYGDAVFYGSLGGTALNAPVVGMAATPDGKGYWLAGSDGGVFSFGDAGFYGSWSGHALNGSIVGIASSHDGAGYWLAGSDGGVFSFGDAPFEGSVPAGHLHAPVVGILPTSDGTGYWLDASDGGVFALGDAEFMGSMAVSPLNAPVVAMSS